MATVTLPVLDFRGGVSSTIPRDFEIDELSFTRSITRQGKGARAAWRHHFRTLPEIPQSHAVLEWNEARARLRGPEGRYPDAPLYGIRAAHRALQGDPWAMIDEPLPTELPSPRPIILFGDEQAAPGSDDR